MKAAIFALVLAASASDAGGPPAPKPDAGSAAHAEKQPAAPAESDTSLPPALSGTALCEELGRAARAKEAAHSGGEELARERERLEQLKSDIEKARASLREETERLEALLAKQSTAPAQAKRVAALDPNDPTTRSQLEQMAKTVKGMKPEQAAVLIGRIEPQLGVEVLRRMKPADAGAVMEKLKPDLAAELFSAMASKHAEGNP